MDKGKGRQRTLSQNFAWRLVPMCAQLRASSLGVGKPPAWSSETPVQRTALSPVTLGVVEGTHVPGEPAGLVHGDPAMVS